MKPGAVFVVYYREDWNRATYVSYLGNKKYLVGSGSVPTTTTNICTNLNLIEIDIPLELDKSRIYIIYAIFQIKLT